MSDSRYLIDRDAVINILTDTKSGYGKLSRDLLIKVLVYKISILPAVLYEEGAGTMSDDRRK